MRGFLIAAVLFSWTACAAVSEVPALPGLEIKAGGDFFLGGLHFSVVHFDSDWHGISQVALQPDPGFPQIADGHWLLHESLTVPAVADPLRLSEEIVAEEDRNGFRFICQVDHPSGLPTKFAGLEIAMPVSLAAGNPLSIDGVEHVLPAGFGEAKLYTGTCRQLKLPAKNGEIVLEGSGLSYLIQDERKWGGENYSVRISLSPQAATLLHAKLEMTVRSRPYDSAPISLASVANRGFRDPAAGDGKGWTSQGPDNDLAALLPGNLRVQGVTFQVVDPGQNGGKGCVVLGKDPQGVLPSSVSIPLPDHPSLRNLYLLHAAAWLPSGSSPIGKVTAVKVGGGETQFEVVPGRDVGNWWTPLALSNGTVAWAGKNPSGPVGLYASRVPLDGTPVSEIRLESAGNAMWMVAALSGSVDPLHFTSQVPETIAEGPEWVPYACSPRIAEKSVFDFSFLNDAPAGKYGPVLATSRGAFAFRDRPDAPVRFWGVNLVGLANYPTKEQADQIAENLARSGYNTARLHHYDGKLLVAGGNSYDLDPAALDRLDYLFAALKKKGIYLNIDLYTVRGFSPDEKAAFGWPSGNGSGNGLDRIWWYKATLPISEAAFDSWRRFATNLLTHRNPYTGLTWAEDPALIGICPVNEDTITSAIGKDPELKRRYEERFAVWQSDPKNSKTGETKEIAFSRFLLETELAADAREKKVLRDLGVQALVTGSNFVDTQAQAFLRDRYDYVDSHTYWDHPTFPGAPWKLPYQFQQRDPVAAEAQVPRQIMASRIFGKPFVVTEAHYAWPNARRASGGVLMPAYASLQDWNAIYNFDYATDPDTALDGSVSNVFDLVGDPIDLLADRLSALLFRRGDVKPAPRAICFAVNPATALAGENGKWRDFPGSFTLLGLVTRIGSLPLGADDGRIASLASTNGVVAFAVDSSAPAPSSPDKVYRADKGLIPELTSAGLLPASSVNREERRYVSETGQIILSGTAEAVQVVTERSECFVVPANGTPEGHAVAVKNGTTPATIAVAAVDGLPLGESRRILVLHLTDSLDAGTRFSGSAHDSVEEVGHLPHLLRKGAAQIVLHLGDPSPWQAWTVDAGGNRLERVPLKASDGGFLLPVDTSRKGGCLAYELVKSAPPR